ncbi:MAG: FtsX-like permease family protein [Ktedonobacterales bacterium]
MARIAQKAPVRRGNAGLILPAFVVARSQLRQTWRLLTLIGISMVIAAILVCAVPLFSRMTITAGMRAALATDPDNALLLASGYPLTVSSAVFHKAQDTIDGDVRSYVGPYVSPSSAFYMQMQGFPVLWQTHEAPAQANPRTARDTMDLIGATPAVVTAHSKLVQGRWPQASSAGATTVEVAITANAATQMGLAAGQSVPITITYHQNQVGTFKRTLTLSIVGIFAIPARIDTYWNASTFQPVPRGMQGGYSYTALASPDALLAAIDALGLASSGGREAGIILEGQSQFVIAYHLDPMRISADNIDDLINELGQLQVGITDDFAGGENVLGAGFHGDAFNQGGALQRFRDRMFVPQMPVTIFLVESMALVLLFIGMMTDLLVEGQSEAIALLRSRGARRGHVFGALALQCGVLGLAALLLGPALAVPAAYLLGRQTLGRNDYGALATLMHDPLSAVQSVSGYALAMAVAAVLTMFGAVSVAARADMLSARRESARSTRRPLWQRLYLDAIIAVIALLGYGASLYLTQSSIYDEQASVILAPLSLIAPVLLLLASALLFLRGFSLLLRGAERLAARGRGASPLLALAQIARAPNRTIRMTLLLALSLALLIFTQTFTASQARRNIDAAAYQVGADFRGIPDNFLKPDAPPTRDWLAAETRRYSAIPGVTSATLGLVTTLPQSALDEDVSIQAVDAKTFASSAVWPSIPDRTAAQPSLATLMARLAAMRTPGLAVTSIPAVVDANLWQALHLDRGNHSFTLVSSSGASILAGGAEVSFVAIGVLPHIPPVADRSEGSGSRGGYTSKGILVDYLTYAASYAKQAGTKPPHPDMVWLRTRDDATSLVHVRTALNTKPLQVVSLLDRRVLLAELGRDPLYLDLVGVLNVCAELALLLALAGDLLTSWIGARQRITGFALLRALGGEPHQIAGVLLWEQGIIYATALVLGLALGLLLALSVVPVLVYTGVVSTGNDNAISNAEFFARQHVPPVSIVWPPTLAAILIGVGVLCAIAITLMTRTVSRPAIGRTLRLNED